MSEAAKPRPNAAVSPPTASPRTSRAKLLALPDAPRQGYVRVAAIGADAVAKRRLAELGVRRGTVLEIVQQQGPDGVIVGLGADRLALPRHLAELVRVTDGLQEIPGGPGTAS
jgi:Fe2+ transport system protein FeoA